MVRTAMFAGVNCAPGGAFTVTVVVLVLFPLAGSGVGLLTVAVFDSGPGVKLLLTVALIVIVAALFGATGSRSPILQVMVCVPLQVPLVDVAETSVSPLASGSETLTPEAAAGPLLVTTIVYVRVSLARTGFGEAVLAIERSA